MVVKIMNQKTKSPGVYIWLSQRLGKFYLYFAFCLMEHSCLERFNKPRSKYVSNTFYKLKMSLHFFKSHPPTLIFWWYMAKLIQPKGIINLNLYGRANTPHPQVQTRASHHIYTSCHCCIKALFYATFLPVGIRQHFCPKWQVRSSLHPSFRPQTLFTLTLLVFAQNPKYS